MKLKLIFAVTLSAFALAVSSATAQTTAVTKPVGYHTLTIKGNPTTPLFNFIGTNFTKKILAAGSIDPAGTSTVVAPFTIEDENANFVAAVGSETNLFVEITSGNAAGANTTIASVSTIALTTDDNLSALPQPPLAGDTYVVRASLTISEAFGPNNESAFKPGSSATADIIWIPVGGSFEQFYYNDLTIGTALTPGWKKAGAGNADFGDQPIYFTDAIFVERKPTTEPDLDVVVTGHVKTTGAKLPVSVGFNYFDRIFPVGATLSNTNLYDGALPQDERLAAGSSGTADIVWMQNPDPSMGWDQFYYNDLTIGTALTPGWKRAGSGNASYDDEPLRAGIIIERKVANGPAFNLALQNPPLYDNL